MQRIEIDWRLTILLSVFAALHACTLTEVQRVVPESLVSTTPVSPVEPAAPMPVQTAALSPPNSSAPIANPVMTIPDDFASIIQAMTEISRAMSLGGDSLRREVAAATSAWSKSKADISRFKLATLIAFTSANASDDQRALSLLEPWYGKSADPNVFKAAADLIIIPLIEKQKLMREHQKQLDAQRERADTLKKELEQTAAKLEALRQLEKSLGNRRRAP